MKKYFVMFLAVATLWSCHTDQDYENLNVDPKSPTQVPADFLFNGATVRLARQMASPNVNLNIFRFVAQYLTPTTYTDEANFDLNNRGIPQNHWSILYRNVIADLRDARRFVEENPALSEANRNARLAQIEVIEVYTWQILVDTFGDVPYTEAIQSDINSPAYDDAATIYSDLISRLSAAAPMLQNGQGFGTDPVYSGNMGNWFRFANSLQLRLAMRIADVNPTLSKSTAEAAVARGVFESMAQSARVAFDAAPPYTNPLWNDLVQSGRSDYIAANTMVNYMRAFNDPRISTYYANNIASGYVGGVYGTNSAFSTHSHIGTRFLDPTLPGILQDYVEVKFLLAEAAQRGYNVPGTAQQHYNEAITASIIFYGGTAAQAATYIAQPSVAYNAANWRESIGTQFWIAMFDNPFEGWSVYRKYNAPQLALSGLLQRPVPLRFTYPINEQNLNEANWTAASTAIGGDTQQTRLFWDVN